MDAGPLSAALPAFKAALCGDLNVAGAIGALNEGVGQYAQNMDDVNADSELNALDAMNEVLGVLELQREARASSGEDATLIEAKIADRNAARKAKDFKRSDQIRDELLAMGIEIKDSAQGTTWSRIVK